MGKVFLLRARSILLLLILVPSSIEAIADFLLDRK